MSDQPLRVDALVLYKNRPARVTEVGGKKITIQDETGRSQVRPKDVTVLHGGPLRSLGELTRPGGEVEAAWELLAGEETSLAEIAELAYESFTPVTAWAVWELVSDGLYFSGTPDAVLARSAAEVEAERTSRAARAAEEQAWADFAGRVADRRILPEDEEYLTDVVELARGDRDQSRTLARLAMTATPEDAHRLLLELGVWDERINPHPSRLKLPDEDPDLPIGELPEESRTDLTHLLALAIDDEGNQDPDDAITLEGSRLWVHVADVAALVPPDSPADLEARARGANLYLPEKTVHMLPPALTAQLGLGLIDPSPALSIGIDVAEDGTVAQVEIVPSWVSVTRLSYAEAEAQLDEPMLAALLRLADASQARRLAAGAIELDLPEVKIRVVDDEVVVRPLPSLRSRFLVREAMLIAGEAVAKYAVEHELPMLYTCQSAPDSDDIQSLQAAETLAENFAVRKLMKPGRQYPEPGPHAGLGLAMYVQVTSPLRRYLDLVAHQQLRAHIFGAPPLTDEELNARLGAYRSVIGSVRQGERRSNLHWTLVYLLRHPDWQGEGVVVDQRGNRAVVLIPSLALDTDVYGQPHVTPDDSLDLAVQEVNLPAQEVRLRVVG